MQNWHSQKLTDIIKRFETDLANGLSANEIPARQKQYGRNELPKGRRVTALEMFFNQFKSPLVYILCAAAILTWIIKEYADSAVIMAVVVMNAFIGLFQEYRANQIFEKLKQLVKIHAFVRRDGQIHEIESADLVPGDIIILKGGYKVPADARLIDTATLETNEALLTGESKSVTKNTRTVPEKAMIGDRANMVFMGTVIERGEGLGVVTDTGAATEIGVITVLTQSTVEELSPLQIRMQRLGGFLTKLFLAVSAAIFLIGVIEGDDPIEMIKTTVAVAVAAIPEGLPAAISIILAVSSQNILRRKGLVRKLVAAETLGSTSVISTDKTGTLTYGVMKVEEILSERPEQVLAALALANEALIETEGGKFMVKGESTDKAKLEKFLSSGKTLASLQKQYPRLALLPFEESRKLIASFHTYKDSLQIFVNGAPEAVLAKCGLDKKALEKIQGVYENYARRGFRLLVAAQKRVKLNRQPAEWTIPEMEKNLVNLEYLGLVAIRDPIREDVKETIRQTREAGIRVLMVTGDHVLTAKAIGLELGFTTHAGAVLTGEELDQISDAELAGRVKNLEILARVTPAHKMRVIHAWQNIGAVVAMTGDGVNDAPALKAADIGIAVGSGTDVSKEASDLVLLDDSFSTITAAVREGRTGFANIRKATVAVMSNAFTEIILITSSLVFQTPLPITAIQILWVNLAEDSLPVLAMAFEPAEDGIMKSKPISPKEPILNGEHKFIIFAVSVVSDLTLVGIFLYLLHSSGWALEKIQSFIFVAAATPTLFNVFSFKSFKIPLYKIKLFNNHFLIGAAVFGLLLMVAAIYLPFFNKLLHTAPLPLLPALAAFLFFPLFKLSLVETTKWWYRHHEL